MKKLIICLGIFFSLAAYSQPTGEISGTVTDAKTGEPLIGATILIEGTDKGSVTDINGFYKIKNVPPKTYNVKASFIGFADITKYNFVVRSGGNPDLNFELKETAATLGDVVVVADPFEKNEDTPLSIQRLSQEEIATYPGGNNDIAKVVQSLPGVSGSVGGFRNDVIIRGGAPNENVYYLDAIEIPNINHFATQGSAGGPVGLLNVSFFEGVTLSTSAFPAQYDNALSGVLQFDQRDGNARDFKTNIRVSASEAALTFEGPLFKKEGEDGSKTTFIASVRRSYLQLLFQLIDLPFLPDYWDYQYKLTHKPTQYDEINFIGVGAIDNFEINVPDEFSPDQQATLDQIPIIDQYTSTSGISWKHRFKDNSGYHQTALSTNLLRNDFRRFQDNVEQEGLIFGNDSQEWEQKLRFQLTKFVEDWTLNSGFLVQHSSYSNATTDAVNNLTYDNGINFWRYGWFFQSSRKFFSEKLTLSGGVRWDGNTFTNSGNEFWRTTSPRASFSYRLTEDAAWNLNGSVGRYFKIPPYTVLGFTSQEGQLLNQNSEYIQSDHFVLGVEHLITKATKISVESFVKLYDNYPVSVTDSVSLANLGGGFEVLGNDQVSSVGRGRTYGVEALLQQKFTNNFYGILAYTLYKSEFTGFDRDEYLPSVWDNGTLLTFTGGYKFAKNWEIGLRVRYLGPTPFAPINEEATLDVYPSIVRDFDRLGEQRLDAFNQTDLRIDKKWNFEKFTLDIFLEVQNLFGSQLPAEPQFGLQRNEIGNILTPRSLIRIESVDNTAILPSLGVIVDF